MLANLISLYTPNVAISNVIQTYSGTLTSDAHNFNLHVRATLLPHCCHTAATAAPPDSPRPSLVLPQTQSGDDDDDDVSGALVTWCSGAVRLWGDRVCGASLGNAGTTVGLRGGLRRRRGGRGTPPH